MEFEEMTEEVTPLELVTTIEKPTYSVIVFPAAKIPKNYVSLVFSRWLRSLRFGNKTFRKISSKDYHFQYHKYIENLMAKPDSLIRFAVLSDDHDVVLGFAVSREDVLDYMHVHTDYRKIGVGRSLLPPGITTFTHLTVGALCIWQRDDGKYKHLKFNPWA